METHIEAWRDEYGVDSPGQLRTRAADTDDAAKAREMTQAANEWELTRYRLDILADAIENYPRYTRAFESNAHPDPGNAGWDDWDYSTPTDTDEDESLFGSMTEETGE